MKGLRSINICPLSACDIESEVALLLTTSSHDKTIELVHVVQTISLKFCILPTAELAITTSNVILP